MLFISGCFAKFPTSSSAFKSRGLRARESEGDSPPKMLAKKQDREKFFLEKSMESGASDKGWKFNKRNSNSSAGICEAQFFNRLLKELAREQPLFSTSVLRRWSSARMWETLALLFCVFSPSGIVWPQRDQLPELLPFPIQGQASCKVAMGSR